MCYLDILIGKCPFVSVKSLFMSVKHSFVTTKPCIEELTHRIVIVKTKRQAHLPLMRLP